MRKFAFALIISSAIIASCGGGNQDNGPAHDRHMPTDSSRDMDTDEKNDATPQPDTSQSSGYHYNGNNFAGNS